MPRRAVLALAALLALAAPAAAVQPADGQAVPASAPGDMVLGRADAPVTVIEYASVTCPHCAEWHRDVLPELRERFIDTGRVRLVFRELPTPPFELAMGGFMVARCAGAEHYFDVVADLMRLQNAIRLSPYGGLVAVAGSHGMDRAAVDACLADEAGADAFAARAAAARDHGVNSTPSIFVQGVRVENGHTMAGVEAAILAAER